MPPTNRHTDFADALTTGATKFGARFYDPNTGRFTQPDPSGQEQNPYAYAGNNPITYNDPSGLCGEWYSLVSCDEILYDNSDITEELYQCVVWGAPAAAATAVATMEVGPFLVVPTVAIFLAGCGSGAASVL